MRPIESCSGTRVPRWLFAVKTEGVTVIKNGVTDGRAPAAPAQPPPSGRGRSAEHGGCSAIPRLPRWQPLQEPQARGGVEPCLALLTAVISGKCKVESQTEVLVFLLATFHFTLATMLTGR